MVDLLYATLAELKASRRIVPDSDDTALTRALTAASRAIDRRCNRRFWLDDEATARVYGVAGRATPDGRLLIDDVGSLVDLAVESGTSTSWSPVTEYETGPDNALTRGMPVTELALFGYWAGPRVRVTARWGWPDVPDEINTATLLLANRFYMRKDSPEGVAGTTEWGAIRMSRVDPDVEALIGPYRLPKFA
jgi:hypothetical protein